MSQPLPPNDTAHDADARFPIRFLAEKTGVGSSTLRAWERRYRLLQPQRTPKGHRLYCPDDIKRVERILVLLDEGHSLPVIAQEMKSGDQSALNKERHSGLETVWSNYLTGTLQAIADFSTERLESIFNEATSLHPMTMVTERLIEPVLTTLGERWQEREAGVAEEHFYSAWVRNRLGARFHHAIAQAHGPRIVCAGLPDAQHDIGLLLFSLSALGHGYRALYLGSDLPLQQVPLVVRRAAASGIVLSSRHPIKKGLQAELAHLADSLAAPVMLGGHCSDAPNAVFEEAGGIRLGSRIPIALKVLGSHVPLVTSVAPARGKTR